jgi:hypothetical protein
MFFTVPTIGSDAKPPPRSEPPGASSTPFLRAVALDGQGREGHEREGEVDGEDRDHDPLDRRGDGPVGVLGLAGHVGDGLDPRVGDGPERDGDQQVRPARRRADEVEVAQQRLGAEDEEEAGQDDRELREEVDRRQDDVDAHRVLDPADVDQGEEHHERDAEHDVPGRGGEVLERHPARVVGGEERRDGDRDHVVEHLRPGREEGPQLVERAAREER